MVQQPGDQQACAAGRRGPAGPGRGEAQARRRHSVAGGAARRGDAGAAEAERPGCGVSAGRKCRTRRNVPVVRDAAAAPPGAAAATHAAGSARAVQLVAQRALADAEQVGRARAVAAGRRERALDGDALELLQVERPRRPGPLAAGAGALGSEAAGCAWSSRRPQAAAGRCGSRMTARSMTLASSRTLPGQGRRCSTSMALGRDRRRLDARARSRQCATKCSTSSGMSSSRSRSGGVRIGHHAEAVVEVLAEAARPRPPRAGRGSWWRRCARPP